MIIARNKITGDHRKTEHPGVFILDDAKNWELLEADPDGWIPWHGGECPLPTDTFYEVKDVRGDVTPKNMLMNVRWEHKGDGCDIIAYRPILDAKPKPPEWDGELPPVGTMAEMTRNSHVGKGFMEGDAVEVLAYKQARASKVAIVWSESVKKSTQLIPEMLRPIRSEEDRAVDAVWKDIEKDVSEYNVDIGCSMAIRKTIDAMIKAGYRRT